MWRMGTPPEEIIRALPHLTLAPVLAALNYYNGHQSEINAHIERNRIPASFITIWEDDHRRGTERAE